MYNSFVQLVCIVIVSFRVIKTSSLLSSTCNGPNFNLCSGKKLFLKVLNSKHILINNCSLVSKLSFCTRPVQDLYKPCVSAWISRQILKTTTWDRLCHVFFFNLKMKKSHRKLQLKCKKNINQVLEKYKDSEIVWFVIKVKVRYALIFILSQPIQLEKNIY